MRRAHRLEIAVGALVLVGLFGTVALILTADKVRVQRTYQLTAWLQDAGGLRFESPVTLAGIQVGKVLDIRSAGPGEPGKVKATLKMDQGVEVPADLQARLVSSGVFGDSFLALTPSEHHDARTLAVDGTGAFTVQPGFFDEAATQVRGILAGVNDLLDPENRAAAKRLVRGAADLAESAATLAKRLEQDQARFDRILDNLDSASSSLRSTADGLAERSGRLLDRADRLLAVAEERLPGTLTRADGAIDAATQVAHRVDALLADQGPAVAGTLRHLGDAARHGAQVLAALDQGQGVLGQLLTNRDLARDLHSVAVDVTAAAEQVSDRPSRLLFDDGAGERAREHLRRDRQKMRRSLDEGLALAGAPEAVGSVSQGVVGPLPSSAP